MKKDLLEISRQARALLQDLRLLGVGDLVMSSPRAVPPDLPVCPLHVTGVERGGRVLCRQETLEEIRAELEDCRRCPLCEGRRNIVFGVGNPQARLVFVGEAPGREEDERGEPFVGEAGRLLDRILFAMGLRRDQVYICNVEKCRPPQNRDPRPEEIAACEPYLQRQLAAINPRIIVALGRIAVQSLLREQSPISRLRGRWHTYQGIPLMPTYHPAYLLRNPAGKREVWEDMKQVLKRLREES
ncbi:uracil-DNA glycosylase [Geoalkalibacter sp.]|uniref:uracil-DNA glycosylase n=1 Tax=Geoalkalibacter sp. TaxID=3041440 RepID=UPI00272E9A33|nr:uracil-DNA glycosylase [Geoalkalibacter sp.]